MHLPYILMLALINSCIELEISAPSFVDIGNHLKASDALVGMTITYNLIGFCIASVIYGPLSECYGRRPIMLVGNAILAIGATTCVFASSIELLLIARFIQGLGAATSAVVVSAIIADVYSTNKAAKLYGQMNAVFTTVMAMSPVIGGIINSSIGWRGNYGVVAVICIISWVVLFLFLPETGNPTERIKLKKVMRDYTKIFTNLQFLIAATVPSLLYGSYMAFVAIAPFIYMETYGLSIFVYTLHQGIVVAAFALTSVFSGKITARLDVDKTILFALCIIIFGNGLMLFSISIYLLTLSMCMASIGSALIYPIIFARSIEIFPDLKGTASSAIMALRYLLCSGITGAASYAFDGSSFTLAIVISCTSAIVTILLMVRKKAT